MTPTTFSGFEGALNVPSRPSALLFCAELLAHGGAAAGVMLAALPPWCVTCLIVVVAVHLLFRLRRDYAGPRPVLQLTARDEWRLLRGTGGAIDLRLLTPCFVHPLLIVLPFIDAAGKRHVFVLLPDNADADVMRRLRVRLSYGGALGVPARRSTIS